MASERELIIGALQQITKPLSSCKYKMFKLCVKTGTRPRAPWVVKFPVSEFQWNGGKIAREIKLYKNRVTKGYPIDRHWFLEATDWLLVRRIQMKFITDHTSFGILKSTPSQNFSLQSCVHFTFTFSLPLPLSRMHTRIYGQVNGRGNVPKATNNCKVKILRDITDGLNEIGWRVGNNTMACHKWLLFSSLVLR